MMSSFLCEDGTVEKAATINDSISFNGNSLLPVVCDNYMLTTRTRNVFASFLVSVQQSDPPSY